MALRQPWAFIPRTLLPALLLVRVPLSSLAADTNVESRLEALQQQNEALQSQLRQQQQLIDSLQRDVAKIHQADDQRDTDKQNPQAAATEPAESTKSSGFNFGKVHLSGEGGAGIFETGSQGQFPNAEFRVDEAKLFVDAQVWEDVYAFAEINLATREEPDVDLHLGEMASRCRGYLKIVGQARPVQRARWPHGHSVR